MGRRSLTTGRAGEKNYLHALERTRRANEPHQTAPRSPPSPNPRRQRIRPRRPTRIQPLPRIRTRPPRIWHKTCSTSRVNYALKQAAAGAVLALLMMAACAVSNWTPRFGPDGRAIAPATRTR